MSTKDGAADPTRPGVRAALEQRTLGLGQARLGIRMVWALLDTTVWVLAIYLATWLRYQYSLELTLIRDTQIVALVAGAAHLLVGMALGLYARRTLRGSFEELQSIALSTFLVTVGLSVWAIVAQPIVVPRTVPLIAGLAAFCCLLAGRSVSRALTIKRVSARSQGIPVIVFGAGSGGRLLVRNLVHDHDSPYQPVAMLDDDKAKRRFQVDGVRVHGNRDDLERVATKTGATHMVIAIPSASSATLRDLRAAAERVGLHALVVPPLATLVNHNPTARDIRDIDLEDLLGRRPVRLDQAAIASSLGQRTVLVTGAGGSIGSELCRQIARFGPARLILLDRDESALHSLQIDLDGNGLLSADNIALCDIRDLDGLRRVFRDHKPSIVFHAAALKHLPLLERFPHEAWQSNVLGTLNVLRVSAENNVKTFVNISTDKAADPTCVLGYSKRLAERMTAHFARAQHGRYMSVRFGNVLGSRGSVIPAFTAQIRRGGPITVTHPEVKRYFMLIPEACQLVMQASVIGADGEVMVLDMGEQVKIIDVANTLIEMSGRPDIAIRFTGLRPGEKLAEDLFDTAVPHRSTNHPLISAVDVEPLSEQAVLESGVKPESCALWMRHQATGVMTSEPTDQAVPALRVVGQPTRPLPQQTTA